MPQIRSPKFKKTNIIYRNKRAYIALPKAIIKQLCVKNKKLHFVMTNNVLQLSGEEPNAIIPMARVAPDMFVNE